LGRNLEEEEEICHYLMNMNKMRNLCSETYFPLTLSKIIALFFLFLAVAAIAGGISIKNIF
jgi:hypothetical protein